ncbi:MAG: hemerythrin domain-containing protein [Bdellovibrionota bacterium]
MTKTVKPAASKKKPKSALAELQESISSYFMPGIEHKVTDAILKDHDALKKLGKILKDEKETAARKKVVYHEFKSLLSSHTVAEEKFVYSLSEHFRDLKRKTEEGFVEHDVAETLMKKIHPPTTSRASLDHWTAQVQVLAELVEHHLEEEESDLIPALKKKLSAEQQQTSAEGFLKLRAKTQRVRRDNNLGALKAH